MNEKDLKALDRDALIARALELTADRDAARLDAQDARAQLTAFHADQDDAFDQWREYLETYNDGLDERERERDELAEALKEIGNMATELERAHARIAKLVEKDASVGRPRGFSETQAAEIAKHLKAGLSLRATAAKVGVTVSAVRTVRDSASARRQATQRELSRARVAKFRRIKKQAAATAVQNTIMDEADKAEGVLLRRMAGGG